ncbi:hypothetical protein CVT25_001850 [Psilocybe cyanescens]|uniref:Uncharacterized protein n=1 Tax=Psilocybe cyanescens TaxID=93625 RepID=A0A409WQG7_PSICY|nr:hypothetical protein CVT25_001850 [Psilocybe cyanescens]
MFARQPTQLFLKSTWHFPKLAFRAHFLSRTASPSTLSGLNRTAVITGASRGIGRAIALRLAHDGYDVALNDLPSSSGLIDELSTIIKEKTGRKAVTITGDVSVEEDVRNLVDGAVEGLGGIDVMVANAGICFTKSIADTTVKDWDKIQAINSRGTFLCYKYAALQMIKQGRGGRIIGASSLGGKLGRPYLSGYCSTKFVVCALTQSGAQEWAKHGITVNAYAPGPIETDMLKVISDVDPNADVEAGYSVFCPSTMSNQTVPQTALGINGTPEDIAGLVSYLASDQAKFITGQATLPSTENLTPAMFSTSLVRLRTLAFPLSNKLKPASRKLSTAPSSNHPESPRVAVVTGASRGIGRAIALRLAKDGYDLALNDLPSNQSQLDEVGSEIVEHIGRRALVLTGDAAVEEDVKNLVAKTAEDLGGVDVMVANAGIAAIGALINQDTEAWDNIVRVNLKGPFLCYKYAAVQMIKQGSGGRIVGASSVAGKKGMRNAGAYSATKFAVRGLTQTAAQEWAQYGITVNAYAPGPIETDMAKGISFIPDEDLRRSAQETLKTDLGFLGTPEDVAGLVSYLVSEQGRFITGQAITIDGGQIYK